MKIVKSIVWIAVARLILASAYAQTFTNLNFEQANPIPVDGYPYIVTVSSALPAWTVSLGTVQQTQILYDNQSTGATAVTLIGPGFTPIDGSYSVLLQGGLSAPAASISQTGFIPVGTQSLLFKALPEGVGPLDISIGGQNIPFIAVGTESFYTLYAANISAWAGDTEQLTFSALEGYAGADNWLIDDISFSPNSFAPEPGIVVLSAIGGLLFAARKWFVRH
jgi:hypothetical protein